MPITAGSALNALIQRSGQIANATPITSAMHVVRRAVIQALRSARPAWPAPIFVPIMIPAGPPMP
jgi:hypothetical protein